MKTIIRIEHTDGYGMFIGYDPKDKYRAHCVEKLCNDLSERHRSFNDPWEDNLRITPKYFCAYKSVEQLQQWIKPDEFKILKDNGYKILTLVVTNYQEGRDQIIYTKDSIVSTTDISSLF